jgi:hypothetical protein
MEILANKVVRFANAFNPNGYVDLIEEVSETCYPLKTVERRPHLTMELPTLFSAEDNLSAIKLRSKCISDMLLPIQQYMSAYNIEHMVPKKNFITVSKLRWFSSMEEHVDDKEIQSDNFICMAYINDNFTGGELSFPDLGLKYSPIAGDIIIYQSKEKHAVLDLTYGTRYTFGYGLKGPINVDAV